MAAMNKFKIAFLALAVAGIGYGVGRAQEADKAGQDFSELLVRTQDLGERTYGKLADAVFDAPRSPSVTKQTIREALVLGAKDKSSNNDAMLIAQNARIIELLEQLNNRKTP